MASDEFKEWLKVKENIAPSLPQFVQLHNLLFMGGQGIVYRGLVENVEAAIKIYFPGQVEKRIEREIVALRELKCPTVVDLLWSNRLVFRGRELSVVATSYVTGQPLNALVKPDVPDEKLDLDEVAIIGYDVALAIEAMWSRKIVHRDLKPSNILIRPNKRACVIDLGLARHLNDSSLTQMDRTWGTFGYLSPEQTRMVRQLTCKSDVFALGVIMIEGAIGRHPTFGDQLRLEALGLHDTLPREFSGWTHAELLKRMLQPRATRRPLPEEILSTLKNYA